MSDLINKDEAPEGYYATSGKCHECDLNEDRCIWPKCATHTRRDNTSVIFKRKDSEDGKN